MSRRMLTLLVAAAGCAALASAPLNGQEAPRVPGVKLPSGYYTRLAQQPDVFHLQDGWITRAARARAVSMAVGDTLPMVVIPALFADSPEPHVSAEDIQRVLFDGPNQFGTVSEFYEEASGGRFGLRGRTLSWVRTSLTQAEVVGESYGLGSDARTGEYLLQALQAADTTVDFGQYDSDGPDGVPNSGDDDGRVDAVAFEFLEIAASCGGPSIWPHRSRISGWFSGTPFATNDSQPDGSAIVVNDYIVQSATDCGGVELQKATTIAHETGHVLGLPDLYDRSQGILPEQRRWVVGCWSLMAAGAWGCGVDDREAWVRPTHMGVWERTRLGWIREIVDVADVIDEEYALQPMLVGERALRTPLRRDASGDAVEYLLVEYRTQQGFDRDLPTSGVLVYHVDLDIPGNQPCDTCAQHYRVAVLEADGNRSLQRSFVEGGNRGEPGDAWGVAGPGTLTHETDPS
ncbi:MAG: M6 family metalloprotease domain-containing protein, partial [Gemmatimonadales bacterium]